MKTLNSLVLDITVAIIDFLYRGRDYPCFWVLEEIASGNLFCVLKCFTLWRIYGVKRSRTHLFDGGTFCQINETEHLEYMESRDGNRYWIDRAFAKHLVLIYYWINVVYYWCFKHRVAITTFYMK